MTAMDNQPIESVSAEIAEVSKAVLDQRRLRNSYIYISGDITKPFSADVEAQFEVCSLTLVDIHCILILTKALYRRYLPTDPFSFPPCTNAELLASSKRIIEKNPRELKASSHTYGQVTRFMLKSLDIFTATFEFPKDKKSATSRQRFFSRLKEHARVWNPNIPDLKEGESTSGMKQWIAKIHKSRATYRSKGFDFEATLRDAEDTIDKAFFGSLFTKENCKLIYVARRLPSGQDNPEWLANNSGDKKYGETRTVRGDGGKPDSVEIRIWEPVENENVWYTVYLRKYGTLLHEKVHAAFRFYTYPSCLCKKCLVLSWKQRGVSGHGMHWEWISTRLAEIHTKMLGVPMYKNMGLAARDQENMLNPAWLEAYLLKGKAKYNRCHGGISNEELEERRKRYLEKAKLLKLVKQKKLERSQSIEGIRRKSWCEKSEGLRTLKSDDEGGNWRAREKW